MPEAILTICEVAVFLKVIERTIYRPTNVSLYGWRLLEVSKSRAHPVHERAV